MGVWGSKVWSRLGLDSNLWLCQFSTANSSAAWPAQPSHRLNVPKMLTLPQMWSNGPSFFHWSTAQFNSRKVSELCILPYTRSDICASLPVGILARGWFSFSLGLPRIIDFSLFSQRLMIEANSVITCTICFLGVFSNSPQLQPPIKRVLFEVHESLDQGFFVEVRYSLGCCTGGGSNEVWWVIENQWYIYNWFPSRGRLTLAITQSWGGGILLCKQT